VARDQDPQTRELITAAVAKHQAGDLSGAEAIYHDVLSAQPD
jgi:hypothetical protein